MATIDQTFARLQKSTFRAKFHLTEKDKKYIADKGIDTIQHHAADFVRTRLAPADLPNDGKQTPMRGHPVDANNPELRKFVEMCFDPESPMNEKLKEAMLKMLGGRRHE